MTMYIRVRHFFWKIQFGGHFIALGQGISKLFLFFFWDEYFSNNLTSKFGIPCSKVWKIFFFKYSRVTYQKTRIGTLNSNIESIFRNVEKCSIDMWKTVLFEKFPNFTAFLLPVQSIFMISEKWFDIRVQCLNALLLNRHKAIFKKIFF